MRINIKPNTITFNTAIQVRSLQPGHLAPRCTHSRSHGCRARRQACERGAQWAEAVATFERMKVLNLPPDKITYDSLVRACEAGEQWQLANEFLEMASGLDDALDGAGG